MKNLSPLIYIIGAVSIALFCNSISTIWAKGDSKLSLYLLILIFISPLVFITFGLVTERVGLALTSGVVDSLLTISSIAIGLFFFGEWNKVSGYQYLGIFLAIAGIFLMVFFPKVSS